jgi:hypothetical protein
MPGGAEVLAANYVYNSKPDGLTMQVTSRVAVASNILRSSAVKYRFEKCYPLYSSPIGGVVFAKSGILNTPADIMTAGKKLIWGYTDPTAAPFLVLGKELIGFELGKMLWGYSGASSALAAVVSGEVNMSAGSTTSYRTGAAQYAKTGEMMPIFQSGVLDTKGNVVREAAAPDVPTTLELYRQIRGRDPSGPAWEAYKLAGAGFGTFGKALILPPGTPDNIVKTMKQAVIDMVKDPKFLAAMGKINPGAPHYVGAELASAYPAGVSAPPDIAKWLRDFYTREYDLIFK